MRSVERAGKILPPYRATLQADQFGFERRDLPITAPPTQFREWDRNFAELALDRIRTKKGEAGNMRIWSVPGSVLILML